MLGFELGASPLLGRHQPFLLWLFIFILWYWGFALVICFYFVVLGFELRGFTIGRQALHLLSHAPPARFALVILEIGSCFLPRLAWTTILLLYASCYSWDVRHVSPHPTFFCWDGVLWTFCLDWPQNVIFQSQPLIWELRLQTWAMAFFFFFF
jgi:hypothetical protein